MKIVKADEIKKDVLERSYEKYKRCWGYSGTNTCYYALCIRGYEDALKTDPNLSFEEFDDSFLKKLAGLKPEDKIPLKSNEIFDKSYDWALGMRFYCPCDCDEDTWHGPDKFMEHIKAGNIEPYEKYIKFGFWEGFKDWKELRDRNVKIMWDNYYSSLLKSPDQLPDIAAQKITIALKSEVKQHPPELSKAADSSLVLYWGEQELYREMAVFTYERVYFRMADVLLEKYGERLYDFQVDYGFNLVGYSGAKDTIKKIRDFRKTLSNRTHMCDEEFDRITNSFYEEDLLKFLRTYE